MWLLLLFLCRRSLIAFAMTLHGLLVNGHLAPARWYERWTGLRPYLGVVALLACWELLWLSVTLWRRQQALRRPPPRPLAPAEEADRSHITADALAQWRLLKVCIVHFDAEFHLSIQRSGGSD